MDLPDAVESTGITVLAQGRAMGRLHRHYLVDTVFRAGGNTAVRLLSILE